MKDSILDFIDRWRCLLIHRNNHLTVEQFSTCDDMFYVHCEKCTETYIAKERKMKC